MTDSQRIESLKEWNRLTREGAENALVASMYEASSNAIEPIDTFTTWLLVGSAAVASFLLGNADKLVPIIGNTGFLICGVLLCVSGLFGLLAKIFALLGKIGLATGKAIQAELPQILSRHGETEEKIQSTAQALGVTIESEIRMDRVMAQFIEPLPIWARWAVKRNLKKHGSNPQLAYIPRVKNLNRQGLCAFLQALAFLAFIIVGFSYAAAI